MSALPPIADRLIGGIRCPLCARSGHRGPRILVGFMAIFAPLRGSPGARVVSAPHLTLITSCQNRRARGWRTIGPNCSSDERRKSCGVQAAIVRIRRPPDSAMPAVQPYRCIVPPAAHSIEPLRSSAMNVVQRLASKLPPGRLPPTRPISRKPRTSPSLSAPPSSFKLFQGTNAKWSRPFSLILWIRPSSGKTSILKKRAQSLTRHSS